MSFETISMLLNWMEMGALLAILFRLSSTFDLTANTQRELRRAVHRLGDRRDAELDVNNAFSGPGIGLASLPGIGVPTPNVPTICPICRSDLGVPRITQSPALAGGGVPPSVWPFVCWLGSSCSLWRSSSPVSRRHRIHQEKATACSRPG
jgi:hypothetical protein